ncbi:MAG: CBS domain-containing protein [Actinobacteria bacterium]|nr:MAG: CBS domain-containing protein [Actinomycetota bacterium]
MSRRPPLPGAPRLRARRDERSRRILATRAVRDAIVSLAGLVGRPVRNQAGAEIGRLVDVVVRMAGGDLYPPVTGLVVKVGRRLAFIDASAIEKLSHGEIVLRSSRLDMRDFERREGEVMLAKDVLDHQLVDVDGVQVVRGSDLYLAEALGGIRLVGVDVSLQSLVRRLGPSRWRTRPTPEKVIDWAAVQPFGDAVKELRLRTSHEGLRRLRPGELADLLEDLGRPARQELLAALERETAADALEEMEPDELGALLREAEPEHAAALVASMEPDEAVDALRDLGREDREELLEHMPEKTAAHLEELLGYPGDQAAGFMTTVLATARPEGRVSDVARRLADMADHSQEIDAVAVVDEEGRLLGDLTLFDLVVAPPDASLGELLREERPVTVRPDAPVDEVASQLTEARRSSLLVVDEEGRPVGRILADDVVDALMGRSRLHFPRLLQ